MTYNIEQQYFDWICDSIGTRSEPSYLKLLYHLDSVEFDYILDMDRNRMEDGVDLRYRFGYYMQYPKELIQRTIDNRPCSVLEMMAALAIRCEEDIMCDPDEGDRTGEWFWRMIDTLGLSDMADSDFDVEYVDYIITRFLNREYEPNGEGGLFSVRRCRADMRTVEIWYQMMWYLDEILNLK